MDKRYRTAGVTLTINNTRAFCEAIIGYQTEFVRTPKYAINGTEKAKAPAVTKYRSKVGLLPWLELAFGSYFLFMVVYAVETMNYLAAPLLMIFVTGYFWAAFSKLHFELKNRLAWERARRLAPASR